MKLSVALFIIMLTLTTSPTYPVAAPADSAKSIVYVGTFKRESSKGIYAWRMDTNSGEMDPFAVGAPSCVKFLPLN